MTIYLLGCLLTTTLIIISVWMEYKFEGEIEVRIKELAVMLFLILISYAGFLILLVFIIAYLLSEKGNNVVFKIKKK